MSLVIVSLLAFVILVSFHRNLMDLIKERKGSPALRWSSLLVPLFLAVALGSCELWLGHNIKAAIFTGFRGYLIMLIVFRGIIALSTR